MNAQILQDFRVAQLAFKGADFIKHKNNPNYLLLEGIDMISIGDNINVVEISLDNDIVTLAIEDIMSYVPIDNLSDKVIIEITNTLKAKALEVSDRDVMVNGKGELV